MQFYTALAVAVFVSFFGPSLCQDGDEEALQNSGDCPLLTWHHHCSFPIVHECAVDVDCGETENKCCFNGCKLTCQTAVKHKQGKRHQGHTMCEKPMDLVFMIDSSESVGVENFKQIKRMVDRTLTQFTISEKKTHVSIIMIDSVPHIELNLNTLKGDNITSENVLKVVDNLQFISGQTRIDLALRMARKEIFSKLGGGRKHVQKILLVFSDGGQTWNPTMLNLRNEVEDLMMAGVQIYSVGVWAEELNLSNLLDIASSPNNLFATEFYGDLLAQLKKISKVPCSDSLKRLLWKQGLRKLTKKE